MKAKTLVTIVTEAAIEKVVLEEILSLGPDSYTTAEVRGRGPRQGGRWDPKEYRAVRINVLCDSTLGEAIAVKLAEQYFRGYSKTITSSDVSLLHSHPS